MGMLRESLAGSRQKRRRLGLRIRGSLEVRLAVDVSRISSKGVCIVLRQLCCGKEARGEREGKRSVARAWGASEAEEKGEMLGRHFKRGSERISTRERNSADALTAREKRRQDLGPMLHTCPAEVLLDAIQLARKRHSLGSRIQTDAKALSFIFAWVEQSVCHSQVRLIMALVSLLRDVRDPDINLGGKTDESRWHRERKGARHGLGRQGRCSEGHSMLVRAREGSLRPLCVLFMASD